MSDHELLHYRDIAARIAGFLSILAIFVMPYGFYVLLRWVVSIAAILTVMTAHKTHKTKWVITGVIILVLLNPLTPIYLGREIWLPFNIMAAIFFLSVPGKLKPERE
jgi:hypothetical protein